MVAIPVYHATLMNQTRPPGWATIGVVVFGTEARGSKVAELSSNDEIALSSGIFLRALVQTQVTAMVDHLCIAMPTR
jgi:hypothetical protein